MAEEVKKVLFKIEIDVEKSKAGLNELTKATEQNTTAIKATTEAVKAEEGSIASLRAKNKELTAERNNTSTATEAGRARLAQLNAELDKNNAIIKDNVDSYTKQKIGVGDYSAALDKLVPGLGATTTGIKGMITSGLAFIATPIGAVIAALGVALSALTAYFKGSEDGQNNLNRLMLIGSTIMEKIMDVVENLGEAIFNAFNNPKQALLDLVSFIETNLMNRLKAFSVVWEGITNLDFKQVANGFLQMGTGVENVIGKVQDLANEVKNTFDEALAQGNKLADYQAKIDKDSRDLIVQNAKVNLEVAKLRREAVTQEGEEKRKTVEQAIKLEEDLAAKTLAAKQTLLKQAELELKANGDDKDAKMKVAEATAAVINAEAQRFEATLRFAKELEKLAEEEKKKLEKEKEETEKKTAEEEEARKKKLAEEQKKKDEQKAKDDKQKAIDAKKQADKEIEIEKYKSAGMTKLISKVTGDRVDAQKLYTSIFKKGALSETIANTKAGAIAAYKSLAGIPIVGPALGVVAAGGVIAYGAVQASGINALGFAKGGRTPLSGTRIKSNMGIPITRDNGDNLLATVKTNEVILNERHQAMLGGSATFRRIGVPGFADSGFTGTTSSTPTTVTTEQTIVKEFVPVLILSELEAKQLEEDALTSKAQIL
jgi:hypothetical protein